MGYVRNASFSKSFMGEKYINRNEVVTAVEKLKIGVIGTGRMGRNHVRNIASESGLFDLVGIYDASTEQAKKVADQYGVRSYKNPD